MYDSQTHHEFRYGLPLYSHTVNRNGLTPEVDNVMGKEGKCLALGAVCCDSLSAMKSTQGAPSAYRSVKMTKHLHLSAREDG